LRIEVTEWRPIVWERFSTSAIEFAGGDVSVSFAASPEAG
jgi:hypothetical protein